MLEAEGTRKDTKWSYTLLGWPRYGPGGDIMLLMTSPATGDGPQWHTCGTQGSNEFEIMDCRMAHFLHNLLVMQENLPLYVEAEDFLNDLNQVPFYEGGYGTY